MKTYLSLFVIGSLLAAIPAAVAEETPWFDMEKCAMCRNLMAEPGLMQHFTKWEHYKTANGLVSLSVVDKEYVPAFKKAAANMDAVSAGFSSGKLPYLCGSCMAFGDIMMAGAKYEEFESDNIFISSLSSDKPEVIAKIHSWTDRTIAEMAKMTPPPQEKATETEKK